jgi:hypothetical protein
LKKLVLQSSVYRPKLKKTSIATGFSPWIEAQQQYGVLTPEN